MSNTLAGQWVTFFNSAGVPSPAAVTYAHKFVENRIKNDMLTDLNKDHLREMGITPMGDIIAILKHSKAVCEQTTRDKVLSSEEHGPLASVVTVVKSAAPSKRKSAEIPKTWAELPLPKLPRRVLPEHEGKYKIKMPSGTTQRSREILAKRESHIETSDTDTSIPGNTVTSSNSVFARLTGKSDGDSSHALKSTPKSVVMKPKGWHHRDPNFRNAPLESDSDYNQMDTSDVDDMIPAFEPKIRNVAQRLVTINSKPASRVTTTAVKAYLGGSMYADRIQHAQRIMKLNTPSPQRRVNPSKVESTGLQKSVHSRLGGVEAKRGATKLGNRIGPVSSGKKTAIKIPLADSKSTSVFERLG